jgi:hypothetical protein
MTSRPLRLPVQHDKEGFKEGGGHDTASQVPLHLHAKILP